MDRRVAPMQTFVSAQSVPMDEVGDTRSSRVAHRILSRSASVELGELRTSYTPVIAFAFTVNYILGVGSLAIPFAVYHAGVLFGTVMILAISLLSFITVLWICETGDRARDADLHATETSRLLKDPAEFPEVAQLCELYLGKIGALLYRISLVNLAYAGLIGFAQVFVNSFVSQSRDLFGGYALTYPASGCIFAGIVVPLSCLNLSEQIGLQVAMSVVRFVALGAMILGAFVAIFTDPFDGGSQATAPPYVNEVTLVDGSGFGLLFSTVIYAQLFHHSVPGLLAPLSRRDRGKGRFIFGSALLTTTSFYVALGVTTSLYFGPRLVSSVNLNWAQFTWGYAPEAIPVAARAISVLVVLFPAIDTLSVFPLVAITLGDTLVPIVPLRGSPRQIRLRCRLLASIPPCVIAVMARDLSSTLQFSGVFGIYVAFVAPALLQYWSSWGSRPNAYTTVFSGTFSVALTNSGSQPATSCQHSSTRSPCVVSSSLPPTQRIDRLSYMTDDRSLEVAETRSSRAAHQLISFSLSRSMVFEMDAATSGYSPLVAYSFTVNYILGVGSLGVPYALYHAGLLFGSAMLIFVSWLSYVTVMWVSETTIRARELDATNPHTKLLQDPMHFPEVTTLCERFLGHAGARVYQLSLLGLMYGGLIGYSQVFVNSIVSQLAAFNIGNVIVAAVFGLIVVPLSCCDLNEQIHVQVGMAILRFVALLTMILSAGVAIWTNPNDSGSHSLTQPPYVSDVPLVNFHGFGLLFSTTVFSQLFQHSVPGLLAPLSRQDQPKAASIFGGALLTTTLFYLGLGLSCCYYFGDSISSSVNLNWAHFTWGLSPVPVWAKCLTALVVLFPALDTLSVFPLIAITLGDNLAVSLRQCCSFWTLKQQRVVCRLVAALPPLVIAVLVTDLSITLQISGVFGVYVAFIAPALLQWAARREDPRDNMYSGRFSGDPYIYLVLAFGLVAFCILSFQIGTQGV
ncbi:transmembrane protein [Achlya hypogyna]|uniref:Transmembrane protein n=1 Tax=Achlya hypogyna TaxID=1202772 RepID=A0A1V9Z1F8_ACHHY|nr:transmembrane protein [Achlya hypogyna]